MNFKLPEAVIPDKLLRDDTVKVPPIPTLPLEVRVETWVCPETVKPDNKLARELKVAVAPTPTLPAEETVKAVDPEFTWNREVGDVKPMPTFPVPDVVRSKPAMAILVVASKVMESLNSVKSKESAATVLADQVRVPEPLLLKKVELAP